MIIKAKLNFHLYRDRHKNRDTSIYSMCLSLTMRKGFLYVIYFDMFILVNLGYRTTTLFRFVYSKPDKF